ncbi:MAG TPA: tripartite tricarboxylate transporter substrate binding protein [Trueperaceae bacterium]|nr:tripartite tricarboxylate transporter substrate binding protein [Trueperaceae bacterium]
MRGFTRLVPLVALLSLLGAALAQPPDTLRLMAPAAPGGGWDGTARAMQTALQEAGIVDKVEVFNVPGAGGTIGLAQLASAEAGQGDLLMVMGLVMVGAILSNDSPVTLANTTPIARLTAEYEVIVVPASSPYQTLQDLIDAFRADPGAVSWGGGSAGGTDHILAGLLANAVGVDPTQVNYIAFSGGGEALASIMGGQVTAGISGYSEWAGQIESGDLRVLAVSAPEPVPGIDAPTLREQGVDLELANWRGVVAPPDLSDEARQRLVDAVDQLAQSEAWQQQLEQFGWTPAYMSGDEFVAYLAEEDARVTEVLRDIGLVE